MASSRLGAGCFVSRLAAARSLAGSNTYVLALWLAHPGSSLTLPGHLPSEPPRPLHWSGRQHYWWLKASSVVSAWAGDGSLGAHLIRDVNSPHLQCVHAASISFERPSTEQGKGHLVVWAQPITQVASYWVATQIARYGSPEEVTALMEFLAEFAAKDGVRRMIWELVLTALRSHSFDVRLLPSEIRHQLRRRAAPSRGLQTPPSDLLRLQCDFATSPFPDSLEVLWHLANAYATGVQLPQFVLDLILGGQLEKWVVESAHPYTFKPLVMSVQFPQAVAISVEAHQSHACPSDVVSFRLPSDIQYLRTHDSDPQLLNTYHPVRFYDGNSFPLEVIPQELDWAYCSECRQRPQGHGFHCVNCEFATCSNHRERMSRHGDRECPRHIFFRAVTTPASFEPLDPPLRYGLDDGPHQATCSGCSVSPIVGTRWQCGHCDTSFCDNCTTLLERHNPLHYFLVLTQPLEQEFKPPLSFQAKPYWGFKFTVRPIYKLRDRTTKSQMELGWGKEEITALVARIKQVSEEKGIPPEDFLPEDMPSELRDNDSDPHICLLHHLNKHLLNSFPSVDLLRPFPGSFAALLLQITHAIFPSVKVRIVQAYCEATTAVAADGAVVEFDRFAAAEAPGRDNTFFMQAFRQLATASPSSLRSLQAYRTVFRGEGANDAGGPFRESLSEMPFNLVSPLLKVFIPCANAINDVGEGRECVVPNPSYLLTEEGCAIFKFVGRLLGISLRAGQLFPITLPLPLWGVLQGTALKPEDLKSWDTMSYSSFTTELTLCSSEVVRNLESEGITAADFSTVFEANFSFLGADGELHDIVPDGARKEVTWENREEYATALLDFKLHEFDLALQLIREGLWDVVPVHVFALFTPAEFEHLFCAQPDISIDLLRQHCVYQGCGPTDPFVAYFWQVLTDFSTEQRVQFLRFVWGATRLPLNYAESPYKFSIHKLASSLPDQRLPASHTCFFRLDLPAYSSLEITRDKLTYAIAHCRSIDTDHHVRD